MGNRMFPKRFTAFPFIINKREGNMKSEIISCVLVASLSFSTGCYSTGMVGRDEFKAKAEQVDITVFTHDSSEYKFLKENYHIQGDTLTGFGVRKWNMSSEIVLGASLSFADIDSIESKEFDATKTILVCGGVGLGTGLIIYLLFFSHETEQSVQPSGVGYP
jgi:hypothetical protein